MVHFVAMLLWRIIAWVELTIFTLVLYLLSYLPPVLRPFYFSLFRLWCRSFTRALGVVLRLHQKNTRVLPERYILIANHPSAFEDIGIPALFPVHSLAKAEVRDWWLVGRISTASGTFVLIQFVRIEVHVFIIVSPPGWVEVEFTCGNKDIPFDRGFIETNIPANLIVKKVFKGCYLLRERGLVAYDPIAR